MNGWARLATHLPEVRLGGDMGERSFLLPGPVGGELRRRGPGGGGAPSARARSAWRQASTDDRRPAVAEALLGYLPEGRVRPFARGG